MLSKKMHRLSCLRRPYRKVLFHPSRLYASNQTPGQSGGLFKYALLGTLTAGSIYSIFWIGAPDDAELTRGDSKNSFFANIKRLYSRISSTWQEPVFAKLLPDPYKGPEAKPYTLVLDLDRFLVCHHWDSVNSRWKIAKRPGADLFLYYMAHLYEVVVFSSLNQFEAEPIMEKLDPYQFVSYRLYRFATKYEDGVHKKDLTKLNRDMSKILVLGHDDVFTAFPDNFIKVAPWEGQADDKLLENSIDFLEALAFSNAKDVRQVLQTFKGQNVFDVFEQRQRDIYDSIHAKRSSYAGLKSWLLGLLMPGFSKSTLSLPGSQQAIDIDRLSYDQRKAIFMEQRKADFVKDMERIKVEYQKQLNANKEYLASNKMPLFDLVTKGPPPPPPEVLATPQ